MFRRLTTLLLIFLNLTVRAQSIGNQVLEEKFNLYHKAHPSTTLFLHIDKTIYTNNEKIWFSAYLLNYAENKKLHNILTVFLTRRDNREVILSEKFKLENGLSSGSVKLPDNTPPGSYLLVAYTDFLNKAGNPNTSFSTLLEVKNITKQGFSSSIILLDSVIKNGGVRAKLTVTRPDAKSNVFPFIKYSIGNRFKDSLLLKKNEFVITIPKEQLTIHKPQLLVSVKFNNQIQYLNASLPEINNQQISIRFFPEGGTLAAGLPSTIAWEAKTDKDIPLCVKGVLFKDNQAIDTIKTNSYGTGTFKFQADGKSNYTLKVNAGDYLLNDTVFALPKTNSTGLSLNIAQAVVNDTLRVNLFTKEKKQVQLLIHNYY